MLKRLICACVLLCLATTLAACGAPESEEAEVTPITDHHVTAADTHDLSRDDTIYFDMAGDPARIEFD